MILECIRIHAKDMTVLKELFNHGIKGIPAKMVNFEHKYNFLTVFFEFTIVGRKSGQGIYMYGSGKSKKKEVKYVLHRLSMYSLNLKFC